MSNTLIAAKDTVKYFIIIIIIIIIILIIIIIIVIIIIIIIIKRICHISCEADENGTLANSVDPDQTPENAASDQDQHSFH